MVRFQIPAHRPAVIERLHFAVCVAFIAGIHVMTIITRFVVLFLRFFYINSFAEILRSLRCMAFYTIIIAVAIRAG